MPKDERFLLLYLHPLRAMGGALAGAIEFLLLIGILKIAFSETGDSERLQSMGVPRIVARAMMVEARFWRRTGRWSGDRAGRLFAARRKDQGK
ncbi:hypothetical protein AA21291_0038 [Swaminathania salitolerans LMG 21291]|uniref:Uncharacterized protein n=1 Tax=Swaminathania salitolerans TaxID=182838 RepID=A0A511BL83_9PROT|nr:hypothetical protein AA21291_0038 [Swaminathania salitolerans LMG 21291]GEL01005.1 hypothetical protein SSA02_01680 [Swaminathania salitolerans]